MTINTMAKYITAISTVQRKKRIPKIIEFLNIAGMVLRKRAMSGKIYIMTIAYATTATAKIAVMIVQNAFSNRR